MEKGSITELYSLTRASIMANQEQDLNVSTEKQLPEIDELLREACFNINMHEFSETSAAEQDIVFIASQDKYKSVIDLVQKTGSQTIVVLLSEEGQETDAVSKTLNMNNVRSLFRRCLHNKIDMVNSQNNDTIFQDYIGGIVSDLSGEVERLSGYAEEVFAQVLHDIRNPIGTIQGATGIIKRSALEGKIETAVNIIDLSVNSLKMICSHVLDYSREIRSNEYSYEPALIRDLIKRAVVYFGYNSKNIKINLADREDAVIICDPIAIERVVSNYLSNAIKYSNDEAIVEINYSVCEDVIRVEVKDNGMGIPPGEEESLFLPFQRSSFTKNDKTCTGLGLAMCKNLIETKHQGKVGAFNNSEGRGATFFFEFPTTLEW